PSRPSWPTCTSGIRRPRSACGSGRSISSRMVRIRSPRGSRPWPCFIGRRRPRLRSSRSWTTSASSPSCTRASSCSSSSCTARGWSGPAPRTGRTSAWWRPSPRSDWTTAARESKVRVGGRAPVTSLRPSPFHSRGAKPDMPEKMTAVALKSLLDAQGTCALIDVREPGEYNDAHIPGASLVPRRQLEYRMTRLVPFAGTPVIVCDDDGRRAPLAAATLERMGFRRVAVLEGGINRWSTAGYPTEWGVNVPSKDFGEKIQVVHHVPEMHPEELHALQQKGEKIVLLDSRTPEEHRRTTIPGARSAPNGEVALHIADLAPDPDATIVVHCAGRTRSIIGARLLQRMGYAKVFDLRNGTMGWMMGGLGVEA